MGRTKPTVQQIYAPSGKLLGVVCRRDKKPARPRVAGVGSGGRVAGSEISQLGRVSSGRVQKPQKSASGSHDSISGDRSRRDGALSLPQRSTNRDGGQEMGRRQPEQVRDRTSDSDPSERTISMPDPSEAGGSGGYDTPSTQSKAAMLPSSSSSTTTLPTPSLQAGDGATTGDNSTPTTGATTGRTTRLGREMELHGSLFLHELNRNADVYVTEYSESPASVGDNRRWWRVEDDTKWPPWAQSSRRVLVQSKSTRRVLQRPYATNDDT